MENKNRNRNILAMYIQAALCVNVVPPIKCCNFLMFLGMHLRLCNYTRMVKVPDFDLNLTEANANLTKGCNPLRPSVLGS